LFALRGKNGVLDSRYLRYFLQSETGQSRLRERATGTTVIGIRQAELMKVLIPVPAIDEQRRIAGVLGALDDLIEVDRRLILDLSNLSDAAFEEWASGVADLVPLDRTMRRVADGVDSDALGSHGIYLGLEHFGTDAVGLTSRGTTDGLASNKVQFKAGDVLYGKLRPYFRKVARPGFSGVCTTEAWVLRGRVPATQEYVHWIARRANFTLTAMAGSEGTKMPRANWAHLARMLVPDPQAPGLDSVSQSVRTLWETACALSQEIEELSAARDELVPLLVSGRVRVGGVAA
jgi:type I restriction enzyme S subunit